MRVVAQTAHYVDKDDQPKRRSPISTNEHYQSLRRHAHTNRVRFRYVLNAVWCASAEHMRFVKHEVKRGVIMPVKRNRQGALSESDKQHGRYVRVPRLPLEAGVGARVYLEGGDFPRALTKQISANEEGSGGSQYLGSSDLQRSAVQMTPIYRPRGTVEPYHKSLKQNAALEKSATRTMRTQTNHLFAALGAYSKRELLENQP